MENLLEGGIAQLEEVKEAIANMSNTEQAVKDTDRSLKAKQKELEIQRKRVEEKIASTEKKARTELEKGFDEQISVAEKAVRDAENNKKNAKAQAVNQRMQRENSSLVDENKTLAAEIKARFKEEGVPAFCKNKLYYSLFQPKRQKDYLCIAIMILIFAGLIPFIITRFISSTPWKIIVWVFIAVFFAAIYFLIAAWTKKGERDVVLSNMRSSVERIDDNKKFIKKRNKNIKADPDESQYNLSEYDAQIESTKGELDTALANKEEAIRNFEEVESVKIRTELEEENALAFQELEKEIDQMTEELQIKSESLSEIRTTVEGYTAILGDKNMRTDKIDEMIAMITEGKAETVQGVLDAQNAK